jgi:small subunit ribosomal protein S9
VPPKSAFNVAPPSPDSERKPKPTSPSFFTARASYTDTILTLQELARDAKYALREAHLIPKASSKPLRIHGKEGAAQWKNALAMAEVFDAEASKTKKLPTGEYREVLRVLRELSDYRTVVRRALRKRAASSRGSSSSAVLLEPSIYTSNSSERKPPMAPTELYEKITSLIRPFQRPSFLSSESSFSTAAPSDVARVLEEGTQQRRPAQAEKYQLQPEGARAPGGLAHLDEKGRAYAVGRRKDSSARVWVVPAKKPAVVKRQHVKDAVSPVEAESTSGSSATLTPSEPDSWKRQMTASLDLATNAASSESSSSSTIALKMGDPIVPVFIRPNIAVVTPQTSEILINNIPLHVYFQNPIDREKVVFPLKATGMLGRYNVFALVRGGGTPGQAGAVAVGLARGIRRFAPESTRLLRGCESFLTRFVATFVSFGLDGVLKISADNLLKRDPRMVERKKTGRAKARKRVRLVLLFALSSM